VSKAEKYKSEESKRSPLVDEIVHKSKAFVLFYASWCPFSQRFLQIFQEYAKSNPQECISVAIDDKPNLCEEYNIKYYPTLILFKNGKIHKRLDAKPEIGLNKSNLRNSLKNRRTLILCPFQTTSFIVTLFFRRTL
jgi:thiol-disulfide isomerase/thioredoxin